MNSNTDIVNSKLSFYHLDKKLKLVTGEYQCFICDDSTEFKDKCRCLKSLLYTCLCNCHNHKKCLLEYGIFTCKLCQHSQLLSDNVDQINNDDKNNICQCSCHIQIQI